MTIQALILSAALTTATLLGGPVAARAQQPAPAAPACPHGVADDEATMVSVVVPGDTLRLHLVVDSVLADLHYTLSRAETTPDQWVTLSKFGWPEGSELAGKAAAPDPGVQIIVDLEPDTAGTMVHVAASAVCLVGTMAESRRPGSPEMAIETVSAVQVASEIRRRMENRTAGSP